MEHPFISTLTRSGPVGQTILAGLLILSLYTWTIVFWKRRELGRAERSVRDGLRRFRKKSSEWLERSEKTLPGPAGAILAEGLRAFAAQRSTSGGRPLDAQSMERVEAALDAAAGEAVEELERGQTVLAIAASASPFIGLFGTVWGIMNAFRGMSLEGSAGIAAVAPGVAEALVTTVAGLAVAIPSVIAYNVFQRRIRVLASALERFSVEFLHAAHQRSRGGSGATEPAPAAGPGHGEPVFARRDA